MGDENQVLDEKMSMIKHKIVVMSGKGGVGKSTVAVNLATTLARKGYKTAILDVDIHGPSVPKLLGLDTKRLGSDKDNNIHPIEYSENLQAVSIGFMLESENDAVIWRGPMKYNVIKQFLSDVSWGELDYLIIDSPPGTGDEVLGVCQLIPDPDGAVIVTTPQDVAVLDVKKSLTFCEKVNIKVLGVVENMSGFVCPKCGEITHIFKSGGGKKMAEERGVSYLGAIPLTPSIAHQGDEGKPFTEHVDGEDESVAVFNTIISKIEKEVE